MGTHESALEAALTATLGPSGRMISWSKSGYSDAHPDHLAVFNANVALSPAVKVWHGDLDLTVDEPLLLDLARRTGRIVYVLYERDGRFQNERQPLVADAIFSATPSGHSRVQYQWFERAQDGSLRHRPRPPASRRRVALVIGRPRLWRFWRIDTRRGTKRGVNPLRFLLVFSGMGGHRGAGVPHSPLLVLGLVSGRRPRTVSVEWTWYPSEKRHAPRPLFHLRLLPRQGRVRPMFAVRVHPGHAYELRLGLTIDRPLRE